MLYSRDPQRVNPEVSSTSLQRVLLKCDAQVQHQACVHRRGLWMLNQQATDREHCHCAFKYIWMVHTSKKDCSILGPHSFALQCYQPAGSRNLLLKSRSMVRRVEVLPGAARLVGGAKRLSSSTFSVQLLHLTSYPKT